MDSVNTHINSNYFDSVAGIEEESEMTFLGAQLLLVKRGYYGTLDELPPAWENETPFAYYERVMNEQNPITILGGSKSFSDLDKMEYKNSQDRLIRYFENLGKELLNYKDLDYVINTTIPESDGRVDLLVQGLLKSPKELGHKLTKTMKQARYMMQEIIGVQDLERFYGLLSEYNIPKEEQIRQQIETYSNEQKTPMDILRYTFEVYKNEGDFNQTLNNVERVLALYNECILCGKADINAAFALLRDLRNYENVFNALTAMESAYLSDDPENTLYNCLSKENLTLIERLFHFLFGCQYFKTEANRELYESFITRFDRDPDPSLMERASVAEQFNDLKAKYGIRKAGNIYKVDTVTFRLTPNVDRDFTEALASLYAVGLEEQADAFYNLLVKHEGEFHFAIFDKFTFVYRLYHQLKDIEVSKDDIQLLMRSTQKTFYLNNPKLLKGASGKVLDRKSKLNLANDIDAVFAKQPKAFIEDFNQFLDKYFIVFDENEFTINGSFDIDQNADRECVKMLTSLLAYGFDDHAGSFYDLLFANKNLFDKQSLQFLEFLMASRNSMISFEVDPLVRQRVYLAASVMCFHSQGIDFEGFKLTMESLEQRGLLSQDAAFNIKVFFQDYFTPKTSLRDIDPSIVLSE